MDSFFWENEFKANNKIPTKSKNCKIFIILINTVLIYVSECNYLIL
ncbi:hypothetical protein LEP1GSC096_0504 [Leptospira interrogans serovar Hebdomadis str. R499]|nr:hypothetical protein LEP1GSC045_3044 [Leptospira interrogans serovar Pomona str. Kennewicki LC82-25]EKR34483.1 hypothetical protein LEP1GSC096_0504 [Leptospira interrogans serovar Hebdomadis str. R499]